MKVIILAAGTGSRLKDLTKTKPKCLVELLNKPILDYQLEILNKFDFSDIYLIGGYKKELIINRNIKILTNENYDTTNMVYTLFKAKELFQQSEDILISYGDIIYTKDVISNLLKSTGQISITVDTKWEDYWRSRMKNPLEDAETLKLDKQNNILEIGNKATSYDEIEAQYMGLIKVKSQIAKKLFGAWIKMRKEYNYSKKSFNNMYMTTFIQNLVDKRIQVKAVKVKRGWVEIDKPDDISVAESWLKQNFK